MEGNGDGMQVLVESSWSVIQGSLDSCVSVVFLDPQTQDPIISSSPRASEKLVLVPPRESVPCEITVKFQGRLCHVQSFYTLSTARICEIYSQCKLETDRDYICTVKGWIPHDDTFSSDEGSERALEAAHGIGRNELQLISRQETSFFEQNGSDKAISSVGSPAISLNPTVDVDFQKSVYSSGEDSWVDVRLSGSFAAENVCVSLTAPELDNWHLPLNQDELVRLEDQLVSRIKTKDIGVEDDTKLEGFCEKQVQSMEHIVQCNAQQEMFEAELELVDHSPWAAITIRLLSLQDKSQVEVDQMVLLTVSGPVPEPDSPIQSAETGANSALLAMFLPSMLQMARGISSSRKDQQKSESASQLCEGAHGIMETDNLPAGREEICVGSRQNTASEEISVQQDILDLPAYVGLAASKGDSSLKLEEVDHTNVQQMDENGEGSKRTLESGELPLQLGSSVMARCNCRSSADDFVAKDLAKKLEAFSERFDRLESLCLRMESYLHGTFEGLDQRISHLEVQHRKGSGDTDWVGASLQQLGMPEDASVWQSHPKNQDCPSSSIQYPSFPDLFPRSESKEEVPFALAQSAEQESSETQCVLKEQPNRCLIDNVDSNFAAVDNIVKEAPSKSEELTGGPATIVGSLSIRNKNPCASLDDAWASALSAFASSFPPVAEAENTIPCLVNEQSSGSSGDASVSRSQDCETLKEDRIVSKATCHSNVDSVINFTNDADLEAINSDHGPAYEECEQGHCDEQMPGAQVVPSSISLVSSSISPETKGISLPRHSLDSSTSAPNSRFNLLGLKEIQSISKKEIAAGVEANRCPDDVDLESMQNFPILSQNTQSMCPHFDVFESAHSNSMLFEETEDNLAAFRGPKTELSPVFDSSSAEMEDATFLFVNNQETKVHPHIIDTECNTFSYSQEREDSSFEGKIQEFIYTLSDKASNSQGVSFRAVSSLFDDCEILQFEENEEGNIYNTRSYSTVDYLSQFISSEQVKGLNTSEVQDPESLNSTSFTNGETKESTSFPDLLEEECSNYQDGRTCSEDSLCFSQDFDACQNDLCDEWSCAPNIFYLHDPELTDDETNSAAADLDEKVETRDFNLEDDFSDIDSTQDVPIWPALHNARTEQTTVFPGFENLS